jgi:hypothetical protein
MPAMGGKGGRLAASSLVEIDGLSYSPGKKCPTELQVFLIHTTVHLSQVSVIHDDISSLVGCQPLSFVIMHISKLSWGVTFERVIDSLVRDYDAASVSSNDKVNFRHGALHII